MLSNQSIVLSEDSLSLVMRDSFDRQTDIQKNKCITLEMYGDILSTLDCQKTGRRLINFLENIDPNEAFLDPCF